MTISQTMIQDVIEDAMADLEQALYMFNHEINERTSYDLLAQFALARRVHALIDEEDLELFRKAQLAVATHLLTFERRDFNPLADFDADLAQLEKIRKHQRMATKEILRLLDSADLYAHAYDDEALKAEVAKCFKTLQERNLLTGLERWCVTIVLASKGSPEQLKPTLQKFRAVIFANSGKKASPSTARPNSEGVGLLMLGEGEEAPKPPKNHTSPLIAILAGAHIQALLKEAEVLGRDPKNRN